MSKKVTNSSNMNEKLRMILSNNLKAALDIEKIMSNLNLKAVSAIGCASVIASCSNKPNDNKDKGKENKSEKKLSIGGTDLNPEQIANLKTAFGMRDDEELSPENWDAYLNAYLAKYNKDAKELKIEDLFDGNDLKDGIGKQLLEVKTKVDNKDNKETSIKNEEYGKLSDDIQEKLRDVAENNETLAKEFWDTIKSEEKIDELIKTDKDFKSKYANFKTKKKMENLITNQLTKAGFDEENREKINNYISFLDDIKVKLNNNTNASNYLFKKLKETKDKQKENQKDIVNGVKSLYEQVISGTTIKDNIKKQLKSMIKSRFAELISGEDTYKNQIEIKDYEKDITIDPDGTVKVKFSRKIQRPQSNDCTIEYNFFKVEAEELKYTKVKDSKEEEQSLSLKKLMYNDDMNLSKYQFDDNDTTALNTLVTPTTPNPKSPNPTPNPTQTPQTPPTNSIKNNIEKYMNTYQLKDLNTKGEIENEVRRLFDFVKNLKQGKKKDNTMIDDSASDINAIYDAFKTDATQGQTAFENSIKAFLKDKMKAIADKLKYSTDPYLTDKYYKNADINANKYDLDALVKNDPDITTGAKFLATLNAKLQEQQKNWFGDNSTTNGTKCSIGNNNDTAVIKEFEIGTDFETVKSDTCKVTNSTIDGELKAVTDLLVNELGNVINTKNLLQDTVTEKKMKDIISNLIDTKYCNTDSSTIKLEDDDLDYNKQFSLELNNFTQASTCKKLSKVTAEELENDVTKAMQTVFGESKYSKALFDAVTDLANAQIIANGNAIDSHKKNPNNLKKTDTKFAGSKNYRGIQFINNDNRDNAQTTFAKTFGQALGKIGEALQTLQNKEDNEVPKAYKDLLKVLFGTYGEYNNNTQGEKYDFAMKDTVFLKWLTCANDTNYGANEGEGDINSESRKQSLRKSLQVMSYLIFVNSVTTFKEQDTANATKVAQNGTSMTIDAFTKAQKNTKQLKLATDKNFQGIDNIDDPTGFTFHFFCNATTGLWLDNSNTIDIQGGSVPQNITVKAITNNTDANSITFIAKDKDKTRSNSTECNNFCHIMKFFGGAENYSYVVHNGTNVEHKKMVSET